MSYGRRFYAFTPSLSSGKSESGTAFDRREDYNLEINRFCDNTQPLADYGAFNLSFLSLMSASRR